MQPTPTHGTTPTRRETPLQPTLAPTCACPQPIDDDGTCVRCGHNTRSDDHTDVLKRLHAANEIDRLDQELIEHTGKTREDYQMRNSLNCHRRLLIDTLTAP